MGYQLWEATNNEAGRGFTHFCKIDYEGINDNATSASQLTIATIPAGGAVEMAGVHETVALAGATDITVDVGTSTADPDEFIDAWDADAGTPAYNSGDAFVSNFSEPVGITSASTAIVAEFNGTTSDLTAGEVIIGLRILDPAKWA